MKSILMLLTLMSVTWGNFISSEVIKGLSSGEKVVKVTKIMDRTYPISKITINDLKYFIRAESINMLLTKAVYAGKTNVLENITIRGNLFNVYNADKLLLKCFKIEGCNALTMSKLAKKSNINAVILYKYPMLNQPQLSHKLGKFTELMMDKYFKRGRWTKIEGEIGRNGVDGLYIRKNRDGNVKRVMFVESKYNGSQLSSEQMTKQWIIKKIDDLIRKYPDKKEYLQIKKMVERDIYDRRLWKLRPGDGEIEISLKKIGESNGVRYIEYLKGGEKGRINYMENSKIKLNEPKNLFQKEIIQDYQESLNAI